MAKDNKAKKDSKEQESKENENDEKQLVHKAKTEPESIESDSEKSSEEKPRDNQEDSGKAGIKEKEQLTDGEEKSEKDEDEKKDFRRFNRVFRRPKYAEPRHPIFSSLFARHIAQRCFGPMKPKWYTALTTAQHRLFKDIIHYVEVGREGPFNVKSFSEVLNDFEPSITVTEVMDVLDSMEKNEFEELDFGKFLFLLAYKEHAPNEDDPGLTEKQMEEKQLRARKNLAPLYKLTASPYACPVPFVPRFKKTKLYKELTNGHQSDIESNVSKTKKISRPIKPIKPKRELGEPWTFESVEDEIYSQMHYGRIPLPEMKMPAKMVKEMRKKCTVEHKDFIMNKSYEALADFKQRMKEAAVIYARKSLKPMLKKDFRTKDEKESFIDIYEKYLPLDLRDVKDFSLWVQPGGYQKVNDKKPSFPDRFAFGSKLP